MCFIFSKKIIKTLFYSLIISTLISAKLLSKEGENNFPSFHIKNFTSVEMEASPQNWSIVQDQKGLIYIANNSGLLIFDGVFWTKIAIPNNTVRSLAVDDSSKIYVGARSEIGYLVSNENGEMVYFSLKELLKEEDRNIGNVYKTYATSKGVFFNSIESLIRFKDGVPKVWYPKSRFSLAFCANDEIYIRENGIGLKKVVDNDLVLIEGGSKFSNIGIREILEIDDKLLVLSDKKGFLEYSGKEFLPFKTEIDNYLFNKSIYHAIALDDDNIVIATREDGIIVLSKDGKLILSIGEREKLQDNNVKYIFYDQFKNLWLGLNNGLSRIEYLSPLARYNKENGLEGIILSIAEFNDRLFVGSTSGLLNQTFFKNNSNIKFVHNNSFKANIWALEKYDNQLFIGTNNGLFIQDKNENSRKLIESRVYSIESVSKENKVYLGTDKGIEVLNYNKNSWDHKVLDEGISGRITSLIVNDSLLWVGTVSNGLYSIDITNENYLSMHYDTTNGLPASTLNPVVIDNRVVITTSKGLFSFKDKDKSFIADTTFGKIFGNGSREVFRIFEDESGDVLFHSKGENFYAKRIDKNKYEIISKPFLRFEPQQINTIYSDENVVWFGGMNSEIIRFDKTITKDYSKPFNTLIRKVILKGDSVIYGGENYIPKSLAYEDRNLRIEYAATFYEEEQRTLYQYKLDGYDDGWSDWTLETKKDYTNLSEGDYEFTVRSKNIYGTIGNSGYYKFSILPPFYRTVFAYIFYLLVVIMLVYLIIRARLSQLKKEKEKLQKIINEKTEEVIEQNKTLEKQAAKLQELDKAKSRFFANISHEFRTPLTLIIGPVEQMKNKEENPEKLKQYSIILRNSKKLLELINQLLDLSKLESGKAELRLSKINIIELAKTITGMFESMAEKKDIKLSFYNEIDWVELFCDSDKVEKILSNLLSNAVKFTPRNGEITVIISKEEQSESFPDGFVKIMVIDTGAGIEASKIQHIFAPFYQVDSAYNRSYEGTGIGLSLVKEFVELHKGTINVDTVVNMGTKFIIRLPLGIKHLESQIINDIEEQDFNREDKILIEAEDCLDTGIPELAIENVNNVDNRPTVLVVEDNYDVREYIKQFIEGEYQVIEAGNGEDGFCKAKKFVPDLIISDVMMPKVDGFEFCKMVKTDINTSHIPVILLTAKAGDNNILQGIEYGADDYMVKPFNVEILMSRIKNLIDLRTQLQTKYKREQLLRPSEVNVSSLDDQFLTKLNSLIEENISNSDFNIENFCQSFYMSRTSLFRKIKALTGESPNQFLRSFRLKRAAQLLSQKSGTITEIAFEVGFTNSAYFSKCFREHFDQTPSEYANL